MRRRDFAALLGASAAWPLAARSQSIARLGILLYGNPRVEPNLPPLRRALTDLGYVEGRNVAIEYRYADGKPERLPELAIELAATRPDVLFALGGDVAQAAVKATRTIPIVFASSADPVQLGFAKSLAHPGGNATGVSFLLDDLASKRLELLKELAPRVARVAFLWHPDHVDNELRQAEGAARSLGVTLDPLVLRRPADIETALAAVARSSAEALYVVSSRLTVRNLDAFVGFATRQRLPLAGGWGAWARAGGLMSYGPNVDDMVRRAAGYVDRILKGAKPADLPIQQPTRFALVVNLKTARMLGLAIPEAIIARADDVIE